MQISYYHFRPSRKILNLDQKLLGKLLVKNFSSSAETLRTTLLISKRLQLQIEKINQKKMDSLYPFSTVSSTIQVSLKILIFIAFV